MDEKLSNVLQKLRDSKNPNYPELFKKAFGTTEINTDRFTKALSQFMLFLVSNNSRYDLFLKGTTNAITATEKEGLALFKQKCGSCHAGELFTEHLFKNNDLNMTLSTDQIVLDFNDICHCAT